MTTVVLFSEESPARYQVKSLCGVCVCECNKE